MSRDRQCSVFRLANGAWRCDGEGHPALAGKDFKTQAEAATAALKVLANRPAPTPLVNPKRKARREAFGRFLGQVGAGFLKRFLGQ